MGFIIQPTTGGLLWCAVNIWVAHPIKASAFFLRLIYCHSSSAQTASWNLCQSTNDTVSVISVILCLLSPCLNCFALYSCTKRVTVWTYIHRNIIFFSLRDRTMRSKQVHKWYLCFYSVFYDYLKSHSEFGWRRSLTFKGLLQNYSWFLTPVSNNVLETLIKFNLQDQTVRHTCSWIWFNP